ncbi:MAG: hypothetical protein KDB08_09090 [Microthrixaceae bacterium]|nr:hypothetical protein [Microthrixaceae bacterium]
MISKLRILTIAAAVAFAAMLAPATVVGAAPSASAAGDVCDICSINFDLGACEGLGGYPYDSTLESPPPALSAPKPAPAPEPPAPPAPAPAAPAAPAPVQQGGGAPAGTTTRGGAEPVTGGVAGVSGTVGGTVAATAPAAPTALKAKAGTRALTLRWATPDDGGSPLTGYTLVIGTGAPIALAADATEYTTTLAAGSYDIALHATNEVGASEDVALAGVVIDDAAAAPAAAATADTGASAPLVGGIVLGALVVLGGGALGWWALRRRAAAS